MSLKAEYVRYDRQIRLWGKTTQQRLMETEVRLFDLHGVDAEIAKNLVLAGIKSLRVCNTTQAIRAADLCNNLLVQRGDACMTCEEAGVEELKRLNPYVNVVLSNRNEADVGNGYPGGHGISIAVVEDAAGLSSVVAQCGSSSDVVVLSVQSHSCILTLFLYRNPTTTMEQQWKQLVEDPVCIHSKPAAYQRMLLALHLGRVGAAPYGERLLRAMGVVARLGLRVGEGAVEEALAGGGGSHPPGPAACTLAGASVAQHLICHAGGAEGGRPWRWMICQGASEVEVGLD